MNTKKPGASARFWAVIIAAVIGGVLTAYLTYQLLYTNYDPRPFEWPWTTYR